MVLVITDLRFFLMEECPPFPTKNASQSVRDVYDRWTKANDKAHFYVLASMSDILSKKHEIMLIARQIMDSLREMFGQPSIQIKQEPIKYVCNARMKEGQSVREHVLNMIVNSNVARKNGVVFDEKSQSLKGQKEGGANVSLSRRFASSSSGSKKIQKKKGGKGKGPIVAAEGKGKAKVVIKRNVSTAMLMDIGKETALRATNHVCSSLQETSSFKQLEEDEMTLKVGMGDVISARAVGDAKLFFENRFMFFGKLVHSS
ncbi:gag/pol protein [Cucumis melo var. makuwa]|uniref:Gag/pol protein n=1 Tax=Cucumis melo var. makuwa TaxID=1194695 RepID=A0A5A7V4I0_CUCMM|nr:gag/pol protein [Cucumis melo var. makuwa]TYK27523.1 gag/pol protein [Cucumis melo var. makuwa]